MSPTRLLFTLLMLLCLPIRPEEAELVPLYLHLAPVRGILTGGSRVPGSPGWVQLAQGDQGQQMTLGRNQVSGPIRVRRGQPVTLHFAAGGQLPLVAEAVDIPEASEGVLIALQDAPEDAEFPFTQRSFAVGPTLTPPGGLAVVNLLPNLAEMQLGDREVSLDPGEARTFEDLAGRTRIFVREIDGSGGRRYTGAVIPTEGRGLLVVMQENPLSPRRIQVDSFYLPEERTVLHLQDLDTLEVIELPPPVIWEEEGEEGEDAFDPEAPEEAPPEAEAGEEALEDQPEAPVSN